MTSSNSSNFTVEIMSKDYKPFGIIESRDKKKYVCGSSGQAFIIQMRQRVAKPKHVYGAVLFIDGMEVKGFKTFKNARYFYGFKLGGGKYKEFEFNIPDVKDSISKKDEKRAEKAGGTIQIKFYNTDKVHIIHKSDNNQYRYVPFEARNRDEGDKFFKCPLSIKEGKEYSPYHNPIPKEKLFNDEYDYIIDFDNVIDEVTFHYTDFVALQIIGVVSTQNIKHFKYIPDHLLQDNETIIQVIKTFLDLEKEKKLHIDKLGDIFEFNTGRSLKRIFPGKVAKEVVWQQNIHFEIGRDDFIRYTGPDEMIRRLMEFPLRYKQYYETAKTKSKSNVENSRSSRRSNSTYDKTKKAQSESNTEKYSGMIQREGETSTKDEDIIITESKRYEAYDEDEEEQVIYISDTEF